MAPNSIILIIIIKKDMKFFAAALCAAFAVCTNAATSEAKSSTQIDANKHPAQ